MKTTLLFIIILSISFISYSQTSWEDRVNIDPSTGSNPYAINSADLDGDGHVDIVTGTYNFSNDFIKWYKNDGSANFTLQANVSAASEVQGVGNIAIADIDGVNGNDIIVSSANNNSVIWYANNGTGGFGSGQVVSNTILGAADVAVADINNDGNLDIAATGYTYSKAVWFAGDGLGNFGTEQTIELFTQAGIIDFSDYDNDGDQDVLISYIDGATQGTIEIYYNQYIESGTMTVSWIKDTVTVDSGNPFLFGAAFADLDNNGTPDIIKSDNFTGEVNWYNKVKNGSSTETVISDATTISRPAAVVVAEIDNDGMNDVILTDGGTGDDAIIWFKGTGSGAFSSDEVVNDNNFQIYAITVNDFDGDGDNDIASVGYASNTLDWYENILETLSTEELTTETLSIFPNPAKDILNIKGISSEDSNIEIYNTIGKLVLSHYSITNNTRIDISNLNSGLYFIKFENSNTSLKFVKE